jgi:phage-related minor tail protein
MSAVAAANALRGITGAGGSSGISLSGMMGGLAGNFSTAASYGTDMFSQQTAMLAAQDSFAEGGSSLLGDFGSWIGSFFAKGGIMTPSGSMPLRAYSTGGIANSPQLAMFGEGRTPEAYVPLPDGKSIPVTMTGGGSGTSQNIVISIVVNKDGKTDTNSTGADAGAWKKMADRVKGVVREELATQTRPGGMLYN